MPIRGPSRNPRRTLFVWLVCASFSGLLLATPPGVREGIATALEWSLFLPVRGLLGWGGRSLATHAENRRLARELSEARLALDRSREGVYENEALRGMLAMRSRSELRLLPARVVGHSPEWPGEVLWIERVAGARRGMAAVSTEGLVGSVLREARDHLVVVTLRDSRMVVSALDARSREQAILRWSPEDPSELLSDPVPIPSIFRVGDPIVTSGLGELFPKGILVGYVTGARNDPRTQMKRIRVRATVQRATPHEVFLLEESPAGLPATDLFPRAVATPPLPPSLPGGTVSRP